MSPEASSDDCKRADVPAAKLVQMDRGESTTLKLIIFNNFGIKQGQVQMDIGEGTTLQLTIFNFELNQLGNQNGPGSGGQRQRHETLIKKMSIFFATSS